MSQLIYFASRPWAVRQRAPADVANRGNARHRHDGLFMKTLGARISSQRLACAIAAGTPSKIGTQGMANLHAATITCAVAIRADAGDCPCEAPAGR
jgi:hypothetical protein